MMVANLVAGMARRRRLGVIPARGGSKGLPGKNVRPLAGLPLIAHSILFSSMCPEIDRTVISTDSEEIARVARKHGGEVPFMRPAELALDDTPGLAVVQHAIREVEKQEGRGYDEVVLLQPTNPARLPEDLTRSLALLDRDPDAVGVIAVSEPHFNPRWVCVEERDGRMARAFPNLPTYATRQQVPKMYRINGVLYLWRRDYILEATDVLSDAEHHRMLIVPEERAVDIDQLHDLQMAELLIREGMLRLPWLVSGE
jgi:CMP-N,N'-diacetyllegionaminic acid synthase